MSQGISEVPHQRCRGYCYIIAHRYLIRYITYFVFALQFCKSTTMIWSPRIKILEVRIKIRLQQQWFSQPFFNCAFPYFSQSFATQGLMSMMTSRIFLLGVGRYWWCLTSIVAEHMAPLRSIFHGNSKNYMLLGKLSLWVMPLETLIHFMNRWSVITLFLNNTLYLSSYTWCYLLY